MSGFIIIWFVQPTVQCQLSQLDLGSICCGFSIQYQTVCLLFTIGTLQLRFMIYSAIIFIPRFITTWFLQPTVQCQLLTTRFRIYLLWVLHSISDCVPTIQYQHFIAQIYDLFCYSFMPRFIITWFIQPTVQCQLSQLDLGSICCESYIQYQTVCLLFNISTLQPRFMIYSAIVLYQGLLSPGLFSLLFNVSYRCIILYSSMCFFRQMLLPCTDVDPLVPPLRSYFLSSYVVPKSYHLISDLGNRLTI